MGSLFSGSTDSRYKKWLKPLLNKVLSHLWITWRVSTVFTITRSNMVNRILYSRMDTTPQPGAVPYGICHILLFLLPHS